MIPMITSHPIFQTIVGRLLQNDRQGIDGAGGQTLGYTPKTTLVIMPVS